MKKIIKSEIKYMLYIPKKSREIYSETIAHRGYHMDSPENTMVSYEKAIENGYAIELDIRLLNDNEIICFHDRFMHRLIKMHGEISSQMYEDIKESYILNSHEKIPLLKDVLNLVNGKVTLLIEVKGLFTRRYQKQLKILLNEYKGKVYFHTKNIITYYRLRKIWKDDVFWILNPLRKRFNFLKDKYYKNLRIKNKCKSNEDI